MTLLSDWERLRGQLDKQDAAELDRLITAYGESYQRVTPEIEALIEYLTAKLEGGELNRIEVKNSTAFSNLIEKIIDELDTYEGYLKTEVATASNAAARAGLSAGAFLLLSAFADELGVDVNDVPRDIINGAPQSALEFLAEYLEKLGGRIDQLSNYHSRQIADMILEGVSLGYNPEKIAKLVTDFYGMGLTDSIRMTRTAQLYSYRQANNAVQVANADLLDGVVWHANLGDGRVCPSCVALHGKVFPVGTICNDHHNGRCVMLPIVKGADNPVLQNGEEWFNAQGESTQRAILGAGKYEAWKSGTITFDQLTTTHEDEVFGEMRTAASLKGILGNE